MSDDELDDSAGMVRHEGEPSLKLPRVDDAVDPGGAEPEHPVAKVRRLPVARISLRRFALAEAHSSSVILASCLLYSVGFAQ